MTETVTIATSEPSAQAAEPTIGSAEAQPAGQPEAAPAQAQRPRIPRPHCAC